MVDVMTVVDHLLAIKDPHYCVRIRSKIAASVKPGTVIDIQVLHEHDDRCCKLEPCPSRPHA